MDLQGQNTYGFSELVYFPDYPDQVYGVQQFLADQGANVEIGDEVEIHDPPDFSQTVFQLAENVNHQGHHGIDLQQESVEIEAVTDYVDMPSFDDLLDFNHFQFVGNHVSVDYDGQITAADSLVVGQSTDNEQNDCVGIRLHYEPCEESGSSETVSCSERGRKRKSHSPDTSNSDETSDCKDDSEGEWRTHEKRENKVASQLCSTPSLPKPNLSSKGRSWKKYRFVTGMRMLISKIEKMKMRTGAIGHFKAIFEKEEYNQDNISIMLPVKKQGEKIPKSSPTDEKESFLHAASASSTSNSNPEPDHSYSATILTQKESSPTVRDHQYNEATTISGKKEKSEAKKQHTFVKGRYPREKALIMLMETIFTKKKDIEASTEAWIEITVDYEDYTFTQYNVKEASNMLRKKRRIRQVFTPVSKSTVVLDEGQNPIPKTSQQPVHEFIIKAPKSSYRLNQMTKIVDSQGKTMKVSIVQVPASRLGPCIQIVDSAPETEPDSQTGQQLKSCDETRCDIDSTNYSELLRAQETNQNTNTSVVQSNNSPGKHEQMERLSSQRKTNYETENEDFPSSPIGSGNTVCGEGSFSPLLSPAITESMFASVSTQSTGTNSRKESLDFGTNTEPICAKCFANKPPNVPLKCQEIFWIRCFSPLCHFIVHASCIGFYVTSHLHLKMLPPFFCENHRT